VAINDVATAAVTAFGVIAALNAREVTGRGQNVETCLAAQSALFQSAALTTWPGAPAPPKGARDCLGIAALDRFYACTDGWILVAARHAADAAARAGALGHQEWARRFARMAEPRDGALADELETVLARLSMAEALSALIGSGVRATPAHEGDEVLGDPYLWANDFFDTAKATPYGPVADRPYGHFSRSHTGYTRPEPGLGEHTFEVLADWGIDPERISALADEGVVMCLS